MKTHLIIFAFLFFLSSYLDGQSKTELREIFDDAEYFFLREDYSEALYYYLQLHKKNPNNSNINFKIGTCLLNIKDGGPKAIPFLEKAIKNTTINYKKRSFNETRAPFHAYYFLGNAYRINNEIDKALNIYNKFINSPDFTGNYNLRIVTEEIKSCERAKIIRDKPIYYTATNIGDAVNTKSSNYNPVISGDGSTIVYMTTLKFYEGIFSSKKIGNTWNEPINLNPQVVSDGDMFPTCLSFDGTKLFLVKKGEIQNDLFYSEFDEGRWSKAIELNDNINSRYNEDHACISKDGKTLYFVSDRRGGEGNYDIYKSEKESNGDWGQPKNLGPNINSPFNEATPFITEDDNRLYFSSDGHFNMGGFDIFYSESKNGEWQLPVNIGFPINTTADNLFFVPVKNGNFGYMALFRDDSYGKEDIYFLEIKTDSAQSDSLLISLQEQEKLLNNVSLKLINEEKADTMIIIFNKNTNRFDLDIPENYKIIVEEY